MSKVWVGTWSDDTQSVRQLARDLIEKGVRAKTVSSPYVGQRILKIEQGDVEKAKSLLPTIDPENGEYIVSDCLFPKSF